MTYAQSGRRERFFFSLYSDIYGLLNSFLRSQRGPKKSELAFFSPVSSFVVPKWLFFVLGSKIGLMRSIHFRWSPSWRRTEEAIRSMKKQLKSSSAESRLELNFHISDRLWLKWLRRQKRTNERLVFLSSKGSKSETDQVDGPSIDDLQTSCANLSSKVWLKTVSELHFIISKTNPLYSSSWQATFFLLRRNEKFLHDHTRDSSEKNSKKRRYQIIQ